MVGLSQNDKQKAKGFVNDGIKRLKASTSERGDFADAYALLASTYGNKIAIIPWAGFWYGPKSGR